MKSLGQKRYLMNNEKNVVFTEGVFKKLAEYFVNWWTHVPICPYFVVLHQFRFAGDFEKCFVTGR